MNALTTPIGEHGVIMCERHYIGAEPTTTPFDLVGGLLGLALQAQCEQPTEELYACLTDLGVSDAQIDAAWGAVVDAVSDAIDTALAAAVAPNVDEAGEPLPAPGECRNCGAPRGMFGDCPAQGVAAPCDIIPNDDTEEEA